MCHKVILPYNTEGRFSQLLYRHPGNEVTCITIYYVANIYVFIIDMWHYQDDCVKYAVHMPRLLGHARDRRSEIIRLDVRLIIVHVRPSTVNHQGTTSIIPCHASTDPQPSSIFLLFNLFFPARNAAPSTMACLCTSSCHFALSVMYHLSPESAGSSIHASDHTHHQSTYNTSTRYLGAIGWRLAGLIQSALGCRNWAHAAAASAPGLAGHGIGPASFGAKPE